MWLNFKVSQSQVTKTNYYKCIADRFVNKNGFKFAIREDIFALSLAIASCDSTNATELRISTNEIGSMPYANFCIKNFEHLSMLLVIVAQQIDGSVVEEILNMRITNLTKELNGNKFYSFICYLMKTCWFFSDSREAFTSPYLKWY